MHKFIKEIKQHIASLPKVFCPRCKRNHHSFVPERNMCAECCDDILELETGCRFGESNCNHSDCGKTLN